MRVTIREIAEDNFVEAIRLEVRPEQKPFVASNAASIAQSNVPRIPRVLRHLRRRHHGRLLRVREEPEGRHHLDRTPHDRRASPTEGLRQRGACACSSTT